MKRLCVCLFVLFAGFGCSSDGPKQEWNTFVKNANDDIILKGDFTQATGPLNSSSATKPGN
jgi:hypothetical protein